jgi:hypothetical protein
MLRRKSFYWVVLIVGFSNFIALAGEVRASKTDPQPPLCQAFLNISPAVIDFGSIVIGETGTAVVTVSNIGRETLTFSAVVATGLESGFTIVSQPSTLTLPPGMSTTFTAGFRPIVPLAVSIIGSITITSNGGNFTISLRARGMETTPPTVRVNSPVGGEKIESGRQTIITFAGEDNDILAGFLASYSIDGGRSFTDIGIAPGNVTSIVWNVPDGLKTDQALVRVVALDRSGNSASATSGLFTIVFTTVSVSTLRIKICFDPPLSPQTPPQNLRVCASCNGNDPGETDSCSNSGPIHLPEGLLGYNLYRLPLPTDGRVPSVEEIAKDENLVGSVSPDMSCFTENISTDKGDNFCYSFSSFFSNGNSLGSNVACSNLPILKNPILRRGVFLIDAASSFIKAGAQLIVNDKETCEFQFDPSLGFFTVPRTEQCVPSDLPLRKVLKKGVTVQLRIKNPDGKLSCNVPFTRK